METLPFVDHAQRKPIDFYSWLSKRTVNCLELCLGRAQTAKHLKKSRVGIAEDNVRQSPTFKLQANLFLLV